MVAFGLAFALRQRSHISVELLVTRLAPKAQSILAIISYVMICFFCVMGIWAGWVLAWDSLKHNVASIEARIPLFIPQLAIVLGFLAFGLLSFAEAIKVFARLKTERTGKYKAVE